MSALAILLALLAAPAQAATPQVTGGARQTTSGASATAGAVRAAASPLLWATVNVCDTAASPNEMGVRASMPGNGRAQRMWMRFSAQVWNEAAQQWFALPKGRSPWVLAGSARYEYRQAGWTFDFAQPPASRTWTLRGSVEVQWRARKPVSRRARRSARSRRARWVVARRRTLFTRSGVLGVDGGDPVGTSKALCLIS
jgi:hypothetical protein